jgi:raffinose/stachyose/melibiose transport system permease protein
VTSHTKAVQPGGILHDTRPAARRPDPAPAPIPPRGRSTARKRARRRALIPAAAFLAPMLAFYAVYYVYAFVFLAQTSTKNVDLSFTGATSVGLRNFQLVLTDPLFWRSIGNNLLFALVQIAIALTLGFFLAVSLASGVRFRRWFYVAFLLPSLIPLSLFATVFGQMIQTNHGAFNQTLRAVGLGSLAQDWTGNEHSAYLAVFVLLMYLIGLPIMYYTSDLTTVNTAVLEAAMIDGARTGQMYRLILFPMLRGTHKTVILSLLLGSFRWFELIYFSTNSQPGGRTSITGTYIYTQMFPSIGGGQIGYASAASLVVLVVAIAVSAVNVLAQRRR